MTPNVTHRLFFERSRVPTLLGAAFLLSALVSIGMSRLGDNIAGVWLANAVAFSIMARQPMARGLPGYVAVFVASCIANFVGGSSLLPILLFSLANIVQLVLALRLLGVDGAARPLQVENVREFGRVFGLAGVIATAAASITIAAVTSVLMGWPFLDAARTWWIATCLGYTLMLPFGLFVTAARLRRLARPESLFRVVMLAVVCAAVACGALVWGGFPFVIAILPLMLIAPRIQILDLATVSAVTGAAVMAAALAGFVPNMPGGIAAFGGGFQVSVGVTVILPFLGGLLIRQISDDARRLAEAETRWNFALATAGQGIWDLDTRKGEISYSATWADMLGYRQDELNGDPDLWLKLVHPDDRERVAMLDRDHMEGRIPHFEAEFRMQRRDGSWIWILDRGTVIERGPDGRVIRAIGSLTDITARREAEERVVVSAVLLAEEKERLAVTLQSIGDAVICTDAADRVTFVNPVAEKLLRLSVADSLGEPLATIYRTVDEETGMPLDGGISGHQHNSRAVLVRRDGSRCSIREMVTSILAPGGESSGSVIVFQDFTDARALQRELAYAAAHDGLTNLANRASFMRTLEAVLADQPDPGRPHHFIYIDLDHFKAVNDTGGHAAGDALLKKVADTIRVSARPGDVAARLGGDEFAIVLKSCPSEFAMDCAETLVREISEIDFQWADRGFRIGASAGLTAMVYGHDEVDEIVARADQACYSAKASGRGCVAILESGLTARNPIGRDGVKKIA